MFKSRSAASVVVRRSYRADTIRSKRRRSHAEEAVLIRRGSTICVFELQGTLFFSTIERVLRQITAEMDSFSYLILDLKRVLQIDECSVTLLAQTKDMLKLRHKTLLLSHLPDHDAELLSIEEQPDKQLGGIFSDIDAALEWCEDQLLLQEQPELQHGRRPVPLATMDILTGFDPSEIALIETISEEINYAAGETIIREGDPADSLYLLAAGRVSICLRMKNGTRRQRLSTFSPGLAFGELALLDGGSRSADVIADEPTLCYLLPIAKLQALEKCHPDIHRKLILNIGRELSARLRRADAEIRALAD